MKLSAICMGGAVMFALAGPVVRRQGRDNSIEAQHQLTELEKRAYTWQVARFNLSSPSHAALRNLQTLTEQTGLQSFGFDTQTATMFVAQRCNGSPASAGDLCITRLDMEGKHLGHMSLKGVGRGISIGVEGSGWLWSEVDPDENGFGKRLARFKFESGKTLTTSSPGIARINPPLPAGAAELSTTFDLQQRALVVRYRLGNTYRVIAWGAGCAVSGNYSDVYADFTLPVLHTLSNTFQGYAVYGQYLYLLTGDSYTVTGGKVNSEITTIDMKSSKVIQGPVLTEAGGSLSFREPHGLAILSGRRGKITLYTGYASGEGGSLRASFYYKNVTIPGQN